MLASIKSAVFSSAQRYYLNIFSPAMALNLPYPDVPTDQGNIFAPLLRPSPGICDSSTWLEDALWFAVPKRKVTRGKKRMKTTLQKRIRLKENIVIDKRTGELTLKHKLPYNWKNYLPENAEHAP